MYEYQKERNKIFTEEGQEEFLKVRDHVKKMLDYSGAFTMQKAWAPISGFTWKMMSYVDRLVELKEIKEIECDAFGDDRLFIKGRG